MSAEPNKNVVKDYLKEYGYDNLSSLGKVITIDDVKRVANGAVQVLQGDAADNSSSNRPGPKYRLPLSNLINNLVDNYANKYVMVGNDVNSIRHFYRVFEEEYLQVQKTFQQLDALNDLFGDDADFFTDLAAYGVPDSGGPYPRYFQGMTQEEFQESIAKIKEKFQEEYDHQLVGDPQGRWPPILAAALNQEGIPTSKSGRQAGGYSPKPSKKDKARKQKKKLIDERNLTQQALLMLDLEEISKRNAVDFKKTGYKNFLCLEDDEPSTMMSRLLSVNFLPISKLKSEHLSALIPEMRFFKVETEIDANGQIIGELGEKEFFFPTFADEDQQKRYNTSIMESWKTLISNTRPNIGIKSIDWSNRSGNYLLEKSGLQFNVQFYAERLADLFTFVEGYDKNDEFRYSDLFTTPKPYYTDKSNPEQAMKIGNENFYRLRAKFGWRLSEGLKENILGSLSGPERDAVESGWKSLTDSNMVVDLTLVNFDLNFEEDGTTVVNVQYNSFIKQYMNNMDYSNILLSEEQLQAINLKRKKQNELEALKKKNPSPRNRSELKARSAELEKVETQLAKLDTNLSLRYSSLVSGLIEKEAIRVHTVRKKDITARFQKRGFKSSSGMSADKGGAARPSINIRVEYPDYTEVNFIDLSKEKKSSLYVEDTPENMGPILKLVKHSKTGEHRYAYYPPGFQMVGLLPGFPIGNKLLTEEQVKPFFANGVSLSDVERISAASENSKQDQDASRNNKEVNNPVQSGAKIDPKKLDIKKYYEKLDKEAFKSGNYNIKYFYLGDLMEVAIEKFAKNTQSAIDLKVILGTVQLKNYPDNVVEGFLDFDIDEQTGLFEIKANEKLEKELKSQGVDSKELRNQSIANLRSNARVYYRSLADIPICFNSFLVWFHDNVVGKKLVSLPLEKFIKDVLKLVVSSHNSFSDYAYMIPKQEINVNRSFYSVPKSVDEEYDYFGIKSTPFGLDFAESLDKTLSSTKTGRRELKTLRDDSLGLLGTDGKNKVSLFESKFLNKKTQGTNKYMFLFDLPRSLPPQHLANFVEDSQDGIPHFFIGSESGLVKSIKFNLVPNPLIQADQMLRRPSQVSPRFPIKGRYECDITLVGNNFFTPGMTIYLNPASLRLGNPMDYDSPINSLGIMGYYQIFKMSSYIQGGTYETKISCRFISPGNGLDEHGRVAMKSPMGNT